MLVGRRFAIFECKNYSTSVLAKNNNTKTYQKDAFSNVTPKIFSYLNRNIYKNKDHPLFFVKEKIVNFFYNKFKGKRGNPIFSVFEDLSPIVSVEQNFDSLFVPKDHKSRTKSDCYYLNKEWMLRAHMTAHQSELLKMGLNNFLMVGDVYRRDDIDSLHYPVFHQLDGVRLFTPEELFFERDNGVDELNIKEKSPGKRTKEKQEVYTLAASKLVEAELKKTLEELSTDIFGKDLQFRWVEAFFPFTHPSFELEVLVEDTWVEILGCGLVEHRILERAGCSNRIGWACGMGLERLAMLRYSIPDIRIFWSLDAGFLHQFQGKTFEDNIKFRKLSVHPPCPFDISFWLTEEFDTDDFNELVREHCGDLVEQVKLIDIFECKKTGKKSHTYRIVYRSYEKSLSKIRIRKIHEELERKTEKRFKVVIR